jgi:hypothetical protein
MPFLRVPTRVGCLVSEFPDHPGHLAAVAAWEFEEGRVEHAYAAMAFSLDHLKWLAGAARHRFGRGRDESRARQMMFANAYVPPGLLDEMCIALGIDRELDSKRVSAASEVAMRDATAETVFLFGVLLMLATPNVTLRQDDDGYRDVSLASEGARRRGRKDSGFRRTGGTWSQPRLDWVRPAEG